MRLGVIFGGTLRNFDMSKYSLPEDCTLVASVNGGQEYNGTQENLTQHIETYILPDHWYFVDRSRNWSNYNTCSMFYHNKIAYDLLIKAGEFDVVIKTRSDCQIFSTWLPFIESLSPLPENTVFAPRIWWYGEYGGMNDQIAFGTPNSMRVYSEVYDNIYKYVVEEKAVFHPESLLKYHLLQNNIDIHSVEFHYKKG